jgi:hypothetical protein
VKLAFKALLSGLATYVPGYHYLRPTGGTNSARYCYSVWLRHLIMAHNCGLLGSPLDVVAELGPGDSIGIGLAALLSGAGKYQALDVVKYTNVERNLAILDELLGLFQNREPVPDQEEFPKVGPTLDSYAFPQHILTDALLESTLSDTHYAEIRQSIIRPEPNDSLIFYAAPWSDPNIIENGSVDMIFSQAVFEHVTDLSSVYRSMRRWLTPTGFLSHQIDFKSHGKANSWDGHWTYSDVTWRVIVGKRPYLLNREPYSTHIRLLHENGFKPVREVLVRAEPQIRPSQLAPRFRHLTDEDLHTATAYILAVVDTD